jgi:hypothetical protein
MIKMGELGAINQVWVNKGGIASIVPLKVLEKIWRITYDSHRGMNAGYFVIHMDVDDIKVRNNEKGMPYLNLGGQGESCFIICLNHQWKHGRLYQARGPESKDGVGGAGHAWAPHRPQLSGNDTCKHCQEVADGTQHSDKILNN